MNLRTLERGLDLFEYLDTHCTVHIRIIPPRALLAIACMYLGDDNGIATARDRYCRSMDFATKLKLSQYGRTMPRQGSF
jgi:hypothetical protein